MRKFETNVVIVLATKVGIGKYVQYHQLIELVEFLTGRKNEALIDATVLTDYARQELLLQRPELASVIPPTKEKEFLNFFREQEKIFGKCFSLKGGQGLKRKKIIKESQAARERYKQELQKNIIPTIHPLP
jgi:hypothetical protein